jgi:hypothetical protein
MQLFIARAASAGTGRRGALISQSKLVFLMRVSICYLFILFFGIQLLLAKNTAGQRLEETFITLELKAVSLAEAFKKIEKMTNYLFAYRPQQVLSYQVSLPKANRSVSATLDLLLKNTNLSFRQASNNIIIYQKDNKIAMDGLPYRDRPAAPADTAISGMVVNAETGQPLENVSVAVKGKRTGTATNNKGEFRLSMDKLEGTLVISSVGYEPQEVNLGGKSVFNISLKPNQAKLDEVVVIGYGSKKRRDLTGAVSKMNNT